MAKKKTNARKTKKPGGKTDIPGKTRFELRFDDDIYEGIKTLAERSGVSLNQLMQGLVRWAIDNGHPGEPDRDEDGVVGVRRQPGCVFFGRVVDPDDIDIQRLAAIEGEFASDNYRKGSVYFTLDFTVRRVVREDEDAPGEKRTQGRG